MYSVSRRGYKSENDLVRRKKDVFIKLIEHIHFKDQYIKYVRASFMI